MTCDCLAIMYIDIYIDCALFFCEMFIPLVSGLITLIYERLCECKVCELPLFILYIVSAKALT